MKLSSCVRSTLFALACVLVTIRAASAQQTTPEQLLEDFIHYSMTANVELASANAQALLALPLKDADLATLLDESKREIADFDRAVSRALMVPELEDSAAELARRIEVGRLDMARDSKRIDQAIVMLTGNQRARLLARNRLLAAGEYAVPALLRQLIEGKDENLKIACQDMIRQIGRQAVTPLCVALPHVGEINQRVICDLLGEIGWNHAAPYLRELSVSQSAGGPVREAAARAFTSVQGTDTDLSTLFTILARLYFRGTESLIAYPDEAYNNVWTYDAFVGLVAKPTPTSIYPEVMTMQATAKALQINPENRDALSLFVGANLKRENDLPEGVDDPIFGDLTYTPDFYATVYGTQVCQDVLGMALDQQDTPLVRDAIQALSKTTGGSNLFSGSGRQSLLECLEYPDRRVQYESALTLARTLPQESFDGDFRVVPLLASAVRSGNQSFALVIADDREDQLSLVNRLQSMGFSIVGSGSSVRDVTSAINESTGVDLVIMQRTSASQARESVQQLAQIAKTSVSPVVIQATGVDRPALTTEYRGNGRVSVVRTGIPEAAMSDVVNELLQHAAGGRMEEAEAEIYAIEAMSALRDIAISNSAVYNISDALSALRDALDTRYGGTRLLVSDILALIPDHRAQRKLFDAALVDSDEQQIELLERVADSVKRFGNMAEQRHVDGLVDLVVNADSGLAEAAARVHGAMNLPASNAIKLIPH
jgi:hypothetical protein